MQHNQISYLHSIYTNNSETFLDTENEKSSNDNKPNRGKNVVLGVDLTFMEAINGTTKTVNYNKLSH